MRFIKLIVISFVLLFVLASIMGALLPAHVLVSRAVNIAAHPDSIKGMISDIQQWEHWVEGMNDSSVRIQSATNAQMGKTHEKDKRYETQQHDGKEGLYPIHQSELESKMPNPNDDDGCH